MNGYKLKICCIYVLNNRFYYCYCVRKTFNLLGKCFFNITAFNTRVKTNVFVKG